jgi:hypothetical protein
MLHGIIVRGGPMKPQMELFDADTGKQITWVSDIDFQFVNGRLTATLTADVCRIDAAMLSELNIRTECPDCGCDVASPEARHQIMESRQAFDAMFPDSPNRERVTCRPIDRK